MDRDASPTLEEATELFPRDTFLRQEPVNSRRFGLILILKRSPFRNDCKGLWSVWITLASCEFYRFPILPFKSHDRGYTEQLDTALYYMKVWVRAWRSSSFTNLSTPWIRESAALGRHEEQRGTKRKRTKNNDYGDQAQNPQVPDSKRRHFI
ncbi:hypothetical protein ACJ73_05827 [Blastomyces percursus]|uniref:Uncharacterized protein n=1 Tax=Blastomyces percursus TaxID=1658174 RepID=A0A1J9Q2P1_9EURO|nr:hypothetical protein ACJ73_05827 [Blastomyces percursus]